MDGIETFKKRLDSLLKKAEDGGVSLFPFLDEGEIGIIEETMKYRSDLAAYYEGGIKNSDRKRCIISSYPVEPEDFKIHVYEIIYNKKYYELYHRSILGALMGLGIKRECVGDIVVDEDKNCFFSVSDEISKFILSEFKSVGKATIELRETKANVYNVIRYETKKYFLSSMRLDVVVAGMYDMSRSEVLESLESGDVSLNHIVNQNPSHIVKPGDEISVRHKGHFKIDDVEGTSRSGRLVVSMSKRI